ncbi:hypothetical protein [Streptomyces erythrochromogenes]|uniref:hypothetical protein n=1 Tax=Streptomyces erythrochromogenes TaxID=285574 RepID=UPI0033F2FCE5
MMPVLDAAYPKWLGNCPNGSVQGIQAATDHWSTIRHAGAGSLREDDFFHNRQVVSLGDTTHAVKLG